MQVHERSSGLLLAEESAAPHHIRRDLKKIRDDLILAQEVDERWGCWVWRVFIRQGDRPAVWAFDWRENLEDPSSRPRPLSHGIVEEAAARRLDSRRPQVDMMEANDRVHAEIRAEFEEMNEGIAREAQRKPTSPVHRSVGLRMARDKRRARGRKV